MTEESKSAPCSGPTQKPEKKATPPSPKDVKDKVDSQKAAVPDQGPKNKGRIGWNARRLRALAL